MLEFQCFNYLETTTMSLNSNKLKITLKIEICFENWVPNHSSAIPCQPSYYQRRNEYIIDQMISISSIVIIVHLIMLQKLIVILFFLI